MLASVFLAAILTLVILAGKVWRAEREGESGPSLGTTLARLVGPTVTRPAALLVFLFFTQSFSGSNMVSYYTVTIFQLARIPLDENLAAVLVAAQYVLVIIERKTKEDMYPYCVLWRLQGYGLSSVLVRSLPRRSLLVASLLLMLAANLAAGAALLARQPPRPGESPANLSHPAPIGGLALIEFYYCTAVCS